MVDQTSQFYALLTNVGAAKQANADALGIPWKITQMAVGDGNPNGVENPALPMPDAGARALLNEWRRAPLNQLKVDDKDSSIIVAEQVIPADVGGRWIREIALYDADGDMVAVANCAPTYKPLLSQGSGRTQVVRMNLVVSSASNVQLKIDPSVVLATREWVTEELAKQDFKHSVLVATTAAVTLSGLQTVDGVALTAGARVLVKHQAAAKDNGLYQVVAGGPWTRCADADTSAKVTPCLLVSVEKGTINADSAWQLVTDGPITLGVSALAFEMAWGRTGVAAGTYRSVTVDAYGRVVAATNPTTVAGYGLTDVYTKTQVDQALALKANLASPALTGVPTAPTAAVGTNTAQLANTAFVQAAVTALVAAAPGALDTLNELASALGNDPNFATTMTNLLALKAPLASPVLTGSPKAPTQALTVANTALATTEFVHLLLGSLGLGESGVNGGSIAAGTDLNTLVKPGGYGQRANSSATLALNYPVALAGTLFVQTASSAITTQLYLVHHNGQLYTRGCYEGFWSGWRDYGVLESPAFRGTPTAPTAVKGTNTTQLATTAFVQAALTALVDTAPGALDTLNELAAALGNDPNFATTMTNYLGLKAPLASPVLTGDPRAPTPPQFDADGSIATTEYVQRAIGGYQNAYIYNAAGQVIPAARINSMVSLVELATDITLPLLSSVPVGSALYVRSSLNAKIKRQGTDLIYASTAAGSEVEVSVTADSNVTLISAGHRWFIAGGASLKHDTANFGADISASGWQHYPCGLVRQWGLFPSTSVAAANYASIVVTLPKAFPNALLGGSASVSSQGMCNAQPRAHGASKTSIALALNNHHTGTLAISGTWEAWGY